MIRIISWKEHMIEKLVFYNVIPEEETEIYTFGMECLVLKLIHCISYLGIAACFGMLPELIAIGCVLIPLRRSAGGYHAKTRTGCYLFSCFYVFIILFVSKAVINQYVWWGALALSDGVIFFMSPVDNDNKKLDEKETLYYRKKSRHILILVNLCCILLTVLHFYKTGSLLGYGICGAAFLLLLQKITTKINKATVNYC